MSNYQDPEQVYDLERDFLAPARSPGLKPVNINYKPVVTPPPLVPNYPSSDSSDEDEACEDGPSGRQRTSRKSRTDPSLSDGTLIRSLDPNQVELARFAEKHALASGSEEEEEEEGNQAETGETRMMIQHIAAQNNASARANIAEECLLNDNDGDFPMIDSPRGVHDGGQALHPPVSRDTYGCDGLPQTQQGLTPRKHEKQPERGEITIQYRPAPPLAKELLPLDHGNPYRDRHDSLITSPALGKYAMTPRFPDPDVILPAIQKSPPRFSPASSPQHTQTLPPLRTHLGGYEANSPGFTGVSPLMGRPSPGLMLSLGPSPPFHPPMHASAMSPPAIPVQFSSWRSTTRDSSISGSSEPTPPSSGAASTPTSSIVMVQSPAAVMSVQNLAPIQNGKRSSVSDTHPIDSSARTASDAQPTSEEEEEDGERKLSNDLPAMSQLTADGSYQCLYPGCTASPFHTQYLLNSHMNVHSETRTHFCHVAGCPHGPGGKGFKRKNEMIR
ncbi:hypothetical protein PV08_06764 [Exophiala spinifera]|uniref:C2H2-type domain-containing protein n=1 Tax=Exophiala spinifera TaxID=91928 RepID=A0A0D2B518_9EURO|nr:uncharacterized protein PV08_06764 [Exophiala spinifera]KIW13983.1 hypothetical protein PV08_06764 [Exophiala spinifera]